MTTTSLFIVNGPGLSRVEDFAHASGVSALAHIEQACEQLCQELNVELEFRQSDDQDEIVRWIRDEANTFGALIFNQMGCADTTTIDYARYCGDLEVLTGLSVPFTEIHMTNVFRDDPDTFKALRGPEGNTSFICGLGLDSYRLAIRAAAKRMSAQ